MGRNIYRLCRTKNRVLLLVVSATSLFWIFINGFVFTFFVKHSELNNAAVGHGEQPFHKADMPKMEEVVADKWSFYPAASLRRWSPVPLSLPQGETYPGAMGGGVQATSDQQAYHINEFNLAASDLIPLNRSLRDVRPEACKSKQYTPILPSTSIIIVFHNEAWSTLLRNVHSIIDRSPANLIDEILLVDDASQQEHLKAPLEEYVAQKLPPKPPVRIMRMQNRTGLVKARLAGAAVATGAVLTFLDAHCECAHGWLEPLLAEVGRDRRTVVCPVIDNIDKDSFQYTGGGGVPMIGTFDWSFGFNWRTPLARDRALHSQDPTEPYISPAMAGGLFSMDKEFFYHLGSYDEDMVFWGGENVEMSLRIWRCGGSLTIHPCSKVGHVFRSTTPHKWPGGEASRGAAISRNTVRTVEVWADEWKELYYKVNPGMSAIPYGDVSKRIQLKEQLQCKSFQWFLDNVFESTTFSTNYSYVGEVRNTHSGQCLDTMGKESGDVGLFGCHGQGGRQTWLVTADGRLRSDAVCLAGQKQGPVIMGNCDAQGDNASKWVFHPEDSSLQESNLQLCLSVAAARKDTPALEQCDKSNPNQIWKLWERKQQPKQ